MVPELYTTISGEVAKIHSVLSSVFAPWWEAVKMVVFTFPSKFAIAAENHQYDDRSVAHQFSWRLMRVTEPSAEVFQDNRVSLLTFCLMEATSNAGVGTADCAAVARLRRQRPSAHTQRASLARPCGAGPDCRCRSRLWRRVRTRHC
jgi:hypothetical protein